MDELVRFDSEDGAFMLVKPARALPVETSSAEPLDQPSEVEQVVDVRAQVRSAATALEDSLASVRGAAVALMATVSTIGPASGGHMLDEVSLELALSFGVAGGVVVAKGSLEAQASVTLVWRAPASG